MFIEILQAILALENLFQTQIKPLRPSVFEQVLAVPIIGGLLAE